MGFLDDGGFLHIRGRIKEMIVLANGQNVFPEDIEAVLKNDRALIDATVVGLRRGQDTQVHAVFLLEDPQEAPAIVARANRELAEHQQVRGYTIWPEADFPRTHTLKVKKGVLVDALQSGAPAVAVAGGARAQPAADAEPRERLVRVVSEVSGVAEVREHERTEGAGVSDTRPGGASWRRVKWRRGMAGVPIPASVRSPARRHRT